MSEPHPSRPLTTDDVAVVRPAVVVATNAAVNDIPPIVITTTPTSNDTNNNKNNNNNNTGNLLVNNDIPMIRNVSMSMVNNDDSTAGAITTTATSSNEMMIIPTGSSMADDSMTTNHHHDSVMMMMMMNVEPTVTMTPAVIPPPPVVNSTTTAPPTTSVVVMPVPPPPYQYEMIDSDDSFAVVVDTTGTSITNTTSTTTNKNDRTAATGGGGGTTTTTSQKYLNHQHSNRPTPEILQLWMDVGIGIDKNQTVVWKSAVESFEYAFNYFGRYERGRYFVERYAGAVVGILCEQVPSKIGNVERTCVQDTLHSAVLIVVTDLNIQLNRGNTTTSTTTTTSITTAITNMNNGSHITTLDSSTVTVPAICGECILIDTVLSHIFNKKKAFYKGPKGNHQNNHHHQNNNNWHHQNQNNSNTNIGYPEVRTRNIEKFRACNGFHLLYTYLLARLPYCAALATTNNSSMNNTTSTNNNSNISNTNAPSTTTTVNNNNNNTQSYCFPTLETIHHILTALFDTLPTHPVMLANNNNNVGNNNEKLQSQVQLQQQQEMDAIRISKAIMKYLHQLSNDDIKKLPMDMLAMTFKALQRIFDRLIVTHRSDSLEFYACYRAIILSMISSTSLPLKLSGWEQVNELIKACYDHRPPPRKFCVSEAGCTFVNGIYEFAGTCTPDGYAKPGADILYVRTIPLDAIDGAGKKLTLFRCTMRSQQKWWFLSEADEEQPGTDRDIDYYQHKSKEHEEAYPPPGGWITSRNSGFAPPPTVEPIGYMVPSGYEMDTLEHQLAKWAIENAIVEQVLGDTTIHREIVARSTVLIKFLASMCTRDDRMLDINSNTTVTTVPQQLQQQKPNMYCLQTSHLLYAWKTCTRKADAAVSLQVYQLLVSILPLCPSQLAIPLLQAIQTSLHESSEKRDYLFEVSEFCSALAALNLVEVSIKNQAAAVPGTALTEEVREEVLNLLWSVLTHPGVSSLKTYDSLKRYVTRELKVEPKGTGLREKFLQTCIYALSENVEKINGSSVDEVQALRMVKLTLFILEACPRPQADAIVSLDNGALPMLLFKEVVAFLQRRRDKVLMRPTKGVSRKPSISNMTIGPTTSFNSNIGVVPFDATKILEDRLRILRHVYGLSEYNPGLRTNDLVSMNASMIHTLWELCINTPSERESLMMFIASASHPGKVSQYDRVSVIPQSTNNMSTVASPGGTPAEPLLSAAFSEDVCYSIFLNLFCSESFDFDQLGPDGYWSFQFLFKGLRNSASSSVGSKKSALDALWRICLTAGNDSVASQAMHDLLGVYIGLLSASRNTQNGQSIVPEIDENFGERIFHCLELVKVDLESNVPSVERSVERCIRILNAAIGQVESDGLTTIPTLARLSGLLGTNFSLDDAIRCLPHGMRAQSCCRRIGILAKRSQNQNTANYENSSARNQQTVKFSLDVHPLETLGTVKYKVARHCQCTVLAVRPVQINGRARSSSIDPAHMSLTVVPEDTVMDELGVVQGCEIVFVIAERNMQANVPVPPATTQRSSFSNDLSSVFFDHDGKYADQLFALVLDILEKLTWKDPEEMSIDDAVILNAADIHRIVWDLLHALPTNERVSARVKSIRGINMNPPEISTSESMEVDTISESWTELLDNQSFDRAVYVLKTIDAFLQPSTEALSIFPSEKRLALEKAMIDDANSFRCTFIEADGFNAVVRFFSISGKTKEVKTRQGNAVALRILKSCLFGNAIESQEAMDPASIPDRTGIQLLNSLSDTTGLLKSLTAMVVEDSGISSSTISDVLRFLRLLFQSPTAAERFVELSDAKTFLGILLMWDESPVAGRISLSVSAALQVRKTTHDLILHTPAIADNALPWLIHSIETVDIESESTSEYFDVLEKLIPDSKVMAHSKKTTSTELRNLANIVCKKLTMVPRPGGEADLNDISTGVLSGCLKLLRALVEFCGGDVLKTGVNVLLKAVETERWSEFGKPISRGVLSLVSTPFSTRTEDAILLDLMGVIFDGFLSPGGSSSVAICCEKDSRARGFDVVGAAARRCNGPDGYLALARRIDTLITSAAPKLRHRWGQFGSNNELNSRNRVSKYAGLRNQGCTCYMNSVLQQLFMIPGLRKTLCAAKLPAKLRSVGSKVAAKGTELVGKKISLQWDSGASFDAIVDSFDDATEMHTIRYCPIEISAVSSGRQQVTPAEVNLLPPNLLEEFVLSEGRPGKETGVFEIVPDPTDMDSSEAKSSVSVCDSDLNESEDEAMSRHLLEEVQRTFIHLEEGSRGQCFDPRALVEACSFLKLEFDVWQQNDASEFATKLLDRLEISLKKWAPETFHSMDHTFGLKQTKQKACKKCGLKTNREEKLLTIDCQIRGKSDIQEALSAMTEVEIMEGSNQVYCDRCKENTDTILKSAISTFPNMLILSLKRFDLDYNTFETVKLNSRCAFGQTLNMKKYSLDAVEIMELSEQDGTADVDNDPNSMDSESLQYGDGDDPLTGLPDDKYEYRLAGVLVHAGVAQGGHYYSFIKDRTSGTVEKWYRFDDDDVTPFDPSLIETECFGGKIKKETKWPNGQVHTVEQEQFANALMVFYEKVIPNDIPPIEVDRKSIPVALPDHSILSGYDVFEPDVSRSNEIHRWQSFLFDTEFRGFLKSLLRFCHHPSRETTDGIDYSWRASVIDMLLSFTLDVMAYSSDYSSMNEWSILLDEILTRETDVAAAFVNKLAKRSHQVSANWLRSYIMDCPDHSIRGACLRIFMAAIRSSYNSENERKLITSWVRSWREQLAELHTKAGEDHFYVPCCLQGKFGVLEDPENIGNGASSLGMILSFTCSMMEAVPRYWRFSAELCHFIRFLATATFENGEVLLRRAMIDSQIPARIIALIAREKTPSYVRAAFPGASVSSDVATTQMRPESNPNAHMMHMSGNAVLNASDLNNPRGPGHTEYITLLEALASLTGIKGTNHAVLVIREADDVVRGRQWLTLTDDAVKALSIIFSECCAQGAPGMGQRDIESYLLRSGVDTGGVSTQKILDMLSKYPTTNGTDKDRATYLSLEGFIAYYRDCVQSNDMRLRSDLHTFGFRPNLTRRSRESRYFKIGERETQCLPSQSVALDIAEMFKEKPVQIGVFGDYGLAHTPHLYTVANDVNGPLMEYLVAAATYLKHVDTLIDRTLVNIYISSNDWEGNNTVNGSKAILEVIAATPGDDQQARINRIMRSSMKANRSLEYGSGIIVVLRALYQMRQSQQYRSEVHWSFNRYLHLLRELYNMYPIFIWMSDNRAHWSFIEREFESARSHTGNVAMHTGSQIRTDYGAREAETVSSTLERNTNSDSEVGMQDSEEDEEDSHVGPTGSDGPSHIIVTEAGNIAVNGAYVQDGFFENAIRYVREGIWNNVRYLFYIFLCNVSNNTKHWYISIVPNGVIPGTSSDIDFYTAPMTESSMKVPPKLGWTKTGEGKDPSPRLVHRDQDDLISSNDERVGSGIIVEDDVDDDDDGPQAYL